MLSGSCSDLTSTWLFQYTEKLRDLFPSWLVHHLHFVSNNVHFPKKRSNYKHLIIHPQNLTLFTENHTACHIQPCMVL